MRLAYALRRFRDVHSHLSEGRRWLAQSLAAGAGGPTALRARTLRGASDLAWVQGDYPEARTRHEESLALSWEPGDKWLTAEALNGLGTGAGRQGDYRQAGRLYAESLTLCRTLGNKLLRAEVLEGLAGVAAAHG